MSDNRPISEQYRDAANQWVDADAAASLLEETKSAVFAEMAAKVLEKNKGLAVNRAEVLVKSSPEWKDHVTKMVYARRDANRHKITMEYLRMRHSEQQSQEATYRTEARL